MKTGDLGIVKFLLESGANIDDCGGEMETPVYNACTNGISYPN